MAGFDMTKYIYRPQRIEGPDLNQGAQLLAKMGMEKNRLAEGARQADQQQSNLMARHEVDSTRLENQRQDVNTRHTVELKDRQDARQQKYSREDEQKVQQAVFTQGKLVAAGKYREALGMNPGLQTMGVDVQTSDNRDGTYNFKLTAPTFGDKPGIMGAEEQPTAPEAQPQSAAPAPTADVPRDDFGAQRFSPASLALNGQIPATMPTQQGGQVPPVTPEQTGNMDQGTLNTGTMESITRNRLTPVMSGIIGSYPKRFQGKMKSLASGMLQSGAPMSEVMEMLKAPQAQATGLMKSQLSAEAARARMRATEGGRDFSEEFKREDKAYQNMHRDAKENGVKEAILVVSDVERIKNDLQSGNGVKVYAALKDLMLMKEKRLTDKDMEGGTYGLISNMDQLKEAGVHIAKVASPEMKRKWVDWAESVGEVQRKKADIGIDSLVSQSAGYKYQAGQEGASRYLQELPRDYVESAIERFRLRGDEKKKAQPTPKTSSHSSSVSVSAGGRAVPKSQAEEYGDFL